MQDSGVAGSYQLGVPHLQLGELIGGGGFAQVFHGYDSLLRRHLAVKILRPVGGVELREVFEAEAAAHGALSRHPNIVTIHQVGWTVDGSRPFLVMDHVAGGSLGDYVAAHGPVPWQHAVAWMIPVCSAVQHAHDQGILHRDIKPDNILLEPPGEPVLSDFGIACLRDDTSPLPAMSIGHAAPEALRGERRGTASDVYSLGSTLYHLLTGNLPFGADAFARFRSVDVLPPPLPADRAPVWLADVVRRAMEPDPAGRISSARDLGRALEAGASQVTLSHPTVLARPAPQSSTVPVDPRPPHPSAMPGAERTGPGLTAVPGPAVEPVTMSAPVHSARTQSNDVVAAGERPPTEPVAPVVVLQPPGRSISAMMVVAVLAAVLAVAATMAWSRYQRPDGGDTAASDASVPVASTTTTEDSGATTDLTSAASSSTTTDTTAAPGNETSSSSSNVPKANGGGGGGGGGGSDTPTDTPAPKVKVTVPDVTGQKQTEATGALEASGLVVDSATGSKASCALAAGLVAETTPAAGAEVDEGTTVKLVLSSGADKKVVPTVTSMSEQTARAQLDDAGFEVAVKYTYLVRGDKQIGLVTAQSVVGGTSASTCGAITITVGREQLRLTPPSLSVSGAEQQAKP